MKRKATAITATTTTIPYVPTAPLRLTEKDEKEEEEEGNALTFRSTLRQLGYLPLDGRYSRRGWRQRHEPELHRRWQMLEGYEPARFYKRLNQVAQLEGEMQREGPPHDWGDLEARYEKAEALRTRILGMMLSVNTLMAQMRRMRGLQAKNPAALQIEAKRLGPIYPLLAEAFPAELWTRICEATEPPQLAALGCTCRRMAAIVRAPLLWKRKLRAYFARESRLGILDKAHLKTYDLPELRPERKLTHEDIDRMIAPLIQEEVREQTVKWEKELAKHSWPSAPGVPLSTVSLARLYPGDGGIFRELYLRLWCTERTETCGMCRVEKQIDHQPWNYERGPALNAKLSFPQDLLHWHDKVVEAMCARCVNTMLMTMAGIKNARLVVVSAFTSRATLAEKLKLGSLHAVDSHLPYPDDPRYFLEDVLASVLDTTRNEHLYVPRFASRQPHMLLPRVRVVGGESRCAWDAHVVCFQVNKESSHTPSHRCTVWEPGRAVPVPRLPKRPKRNDHPAARAAATDSALAVALDQARQRRHNLEAMFDL